LFPHKQIPRDARDDSPPAVRRGSPIEHPHVSVVLSAAKDLLSRTSRSLAMLGMTAIRQPQSSCSAAMNPIDDYLAHLDVEREARRRGWRGSPIEHPHVCVVLSAAKDLLPRTSRSLAILGMTAIGQPQSSYNAAMSPIDDYLAHFEVEREALAAGLGRFGD